VGIVSWILVGLAAGIIGRVATGTSRGGCLFTTLIGVLGGVVGGALFNAAGQRGLTEFSVWSIFVASVGAVAVLLVVDFLLPGGRS